MSRFCRTNSGGIVDLPKHAVFVVAKGNSLKINRRAYTVQKCEIVVNIFNDVAALLWLHNKERNRSHFVVGIHEQGREEIALTGYDTVPNVVKERGDRVFHCNNTLYKVAHNPDVTMWRMADGYVMTMYKASHPTEGRLLITEIRSRLEAFDLPVIYSPQAVSFG